MIRGLQARPEAPIHLAVRSVFPDHRARKRPECDRQADRIGPPGHAPFTRDVKHEWNDHTAGEKSIGVGLHMPKYKPRPAPLASGSSRAVFAAEGPEPPVNC